MAQARAASGPIEALTHRLTGSLRRATRNVRLIVVLSVILIGGSFASAAIIQMRLDRSRALDQAASLEMRRAQEIATDFSATLDRYASIGTAFATATGTAETSAALSEVGGAGLKNIAILSQGGQRQYELKNNPRGFLPLPVTAWADARRGRAVVAGTNDTMIIAFTAGARVVAMQLDLTALVQPASMRESVIATHDGQLLALGPGWQGVPPMAAIANSDNVISARLIELPRENRLVALAPVPHWPIDVGASIQTGEALGPWYGLLPLYFFLIFGPALAGAGLAVLFVREFERRARSAEAVRNLRATRPDEAKMLVRLAEAERRAVESDRAKSEFMAHMSHELRTPLNAIIGFAEVIERGMFGAAGHPKYVEYARDINTAGRALHDKIGDILDFADIEAGRHQLAIASIDIAPLMREVIADAAGGAFLRRIKLTVAVPDNAFALGDASAVKRILANLLANALQYTPNNGAIRLQVRHDRERLVITLRDNGVGFSPDEVGQAGAAFAHFERPGATTGTGLGLSIAMALAQRMDGTVSLQSAQGEGTLAELRLPIAPVSAASDTPPGETEPPSGSIKP